MRYFDHKWPAILLWPLGLIYGFFVSIRNFCYDRGIFKSIAVGSKVISIGNITVGGTGKTPMVHYVVEKLISLDKRVAIISRGYGRTTKGSLLISDGKKLLCSVEEAGDEPYLLAQLCPEAIVAVDEKRVRIAKKIVGDFMPDVIVLDDAYQHRKIMRDIDIVMTRSGKAFGNGFLLPAGPLRESVSGLKRAHIILTQDNGDHDMEVTLKEKIPVIACSYCIHQVLNKRGPIVVDDLAGKDISAFCGIANPESFSSTLAELKVNILDFKTFQDHHKYTIKDLDFLRSRSAGFASKYIITTEKDWVKLPQNELDDSWVFVRVRLKPKEEEKIVSRFENLF